MVVRRQSIVCHSLGTHSLGQAQRPAGLGNLERFVVFMLVDKGVLSRMWVLRRMTADAAAAMGVSREYGSVVAGTYADVIAVNGDPLRHIDVLRDPRIVIRHGRRFK